MNNLSVVPSVVKFSGASEIRKVIGAITAAGAKLDAIIQDTALSVIWHIELHGDVTLACELYTGMPKGSRKLALAEWMLCYGKVVANMDTKTNKALPFLFDKSKSTNIVGAAEKPWFDFKPEPTVDQAFDFAKLLAGLLGKADKAAKDGKEIVAPELLAKVRALTLSTAE